jgi:N-succinyldiaminopimelate aminotransferase
MTRPLLNSALADMGTTIFAEMSALAVETGSINLGQGFPDTDGPAEIANVAADAVLAGRGNQYPPGSGVPELRQAIAAHQKRFYALDIDPDTEVLVTAGATEAVAAAMLALLEPGDEVIALEPYYDSYAACIAMAGARRVPVTLRAPAFRPDLDALRDAVTSRTRLILLNSPHNPTGMVATRSTSTLSSTASTFRSRACPACGTVRSASARPARRSRLRAGRWDGLRGPPRSLPPCGPPSSS